ncbi:mechanosensitive ion channel protein MscS, partial [Chroococcidiopsis cubana CCALA 043]
MDIAQIVQTASQTLTQVGLKLIGAIVFWIVGRWLINVAASLLSRSLKHQKVDKTILSYLVATVKVTLNIILVVAILGFFGIETTSFAALLAAAGVAIGAA